MASNAQNSGSEPEENRAVRKGRSKSKRKAERLKKMEGQIKGDWRPDMVPSHLYRDDLIPISPDELGLTIYLPDWNTKAEIALEIPENIKKIGTMREIENNVNFPGTNISNDFFLGPHSGLMAIFRFCEESLLLTECSFEKGALFTGFFQCQNRKSGSMTMKSLENCQQSVDLWVLFPINLDQCKFIMPVKAKTVSNCLHFLNKSGRIRIDALIDI